ncbi:hypothetical protein OCU04_003424 [Sclerotinia nivalis]|uniref:Uncharacterized protein n=1 Tax=Sclerotinia nivalis TaxID=352851 RepID=A0A9X0DMP4_9HELO|nr:hypothetical protein OCU04_003424 [Sclerotinia nivalis]
MADNNSTLVILLEQVLSNELKNQIVIVEPPTDSTNAFAAFVQTLKNRHLYLIKPTNSGRSLIVPLLYIIIQNLNPVNRILTLSPNPTIRSVTLITIIPVEDPMDFNSQRCTNRHEQGECFHCRSTDHFLPYYPLFHLLSRFNCMLCHCTVCFFLASRVRETEPAWYKSLSNENPTHTISIRRRNLRFIFR